MRRNSKSWKRSLWKKAICLKCSTARSETLPSIFSLPRCTASSKYLSIKWQICTVARELLFSSKAELSSKLSDTGDLNKEGCCFGLSMFCNAHVEFFMYVKGIHKCRPDTYVVQWLFFGTDCIYITSSHRAKLHLENMRDVPQPTIIFNSRQGKTDKKLLKSIKSILSLWSVNTSTLCNMKVLTSNTHHSKQLKNQSLLGRLVKEINSKIICD